MLKKLFTLLILCLVAFPVALGLTQETPEPVRLEITGIDPTGLPTVVVTASVVDALGQPIRGLTEANFSATVEGINGVVPGASIVSVESVAVEDIPYSVVLMIDVSTSMEGLPIEQAKAAARAFVNQIGANDSVAIMSFSTTVQLVQDFTTDKNVLLNAIDSLQVGGQTALYQASFEAVQQALNAPTARRVVIILSDGAEFGDHSTAGREDALQQAIINGVPVYTIGVGYGTDRSFMDLLSSGTNANFYESPDEQQLVQIYGDLVTLLRSQYIITMEISVPGDGQTYTVNLQVNSDAGSASATGVMRAPIPVPLVEVPEAGGALSEPTELQFTVFADDPLTNVTISQNGGTLLSEDNPQGDNSEYTFTVPIDPRQIAPGIYTIDVQATDENGDPGIATYSYEIAALPSTIVVTGLPTAGEELSQATEVSVVVEYTQTPIIETTVNVNSTPVTTMGDATSQTFTLDPYTLPAGDNTLTVTTSNDAGTITPSETIFTVAALPPVITLDGLQQGDVVTEPISVTPSFVSQAPIASVAWFVDSTELAQQFSEPFGVQIDPMELSTGEHTLNVGAQDANGTTSTLSVSFTVPMSVAQTATALVPTATPTFTNTPTPSATPSPSPTVDVPATQDARSTAAAQFAADAQATSNTIGTVTAAAEGTIVAQANVQATTDAQATAEVQATASAQAEASAEAQGTLDAGNLQATTDAQGTLSVEQAAAMETSQANINATVQAAVAQVTATAEGRDTANTQATNDAQMTATSLAETAAAQQTNETATQRALTIQATADALSTSDAINLQATNAQATANAQSTLGANEQATAEAQATLDAANAQRTATASAIAFATQDRANQLTATAIIAAATQTMEAATTATGQAVADAALVQQTATALIQAATETAAANAEQLTATALSAEATETTEASIQATTDAESTRQALDFATETVVAGETLTAQVTPTRLPPPTLTPVGELTEVEAQGTPNNTVFSPLIVGCGLGIILLLIIFFVLNRRRTRPS